MSDPDDITIGEIGRSVERIELTLTQLRTEVRERIHNLADNVQIHIAPMSVLGQRMDVAERNLEKTMTALATIELRSAAIAGALGVLGFLSQFFLKLWR